MTQNDKMTRVAMTKNWPVFNLGITNDMFLKNIEKLNKVVPL